MIDYQPNNSFFAQGEYHFLQQSIPVQLSGNYKQHSQDPVVITVWSDDKDAPKIFDLSMSYPNSVWFEGKTEFGESIWMKGINPHKITGLNKLEGDVNIYMKGDLKAPIHPEQKIQIHAKFSPTSLVVPEWTYSQSYDGTITKFKDKDRKGINWENEHGTAKLIDNYEYVNGDKDNEFITIRIRSNILYFTMTPKVQTDIDSILIQFPKYIAEDLNLLAFIGRRKIVCYEATAHVSQDKNKLTVFARYKTWCGFYNLPPSQSFLLSLIRPQLLQQGLFDRLLINYRNSPYKAVICRTIPYLITSYEDGYLETHLVTAYAALESMVDGIGDELKISYLLRNNEFNKLSGKIENVIEHEVQDPTIREGIIKKIPELRRRAYLDRLLFLLDHQNVNKNLIWPPNTDQNKEFHELLKRRNLLIHTGSIDQGNTSLFDLNRVQKLVELWILKLLDCPEDAIDEYSLWRDAPINQVIHY